MCKSSGKSQDLGTLLKEARIKNGLSQTDIARKLGLQSGQSVSDWERNHGSAIPARYLKKLVKMYGLQIDEVYGLLLHLQWSKLEEKISTDFYGRMKKKAK